MAFLFVVPSAAMAGSLPLTKPSLHSVARTVSADCHAIGQAKASQVGGTLAKATPKTVKGNNVCIIVVLVPGKDGKRPRRAEFVVPQ